MANVAVNVTQALTRHAIRLLGFADLKLLLVVEDPNGNRIWSANGRLRNEFINEGKIENRSWGMIELDTVEEAEEDEAPSLENLKRDHVREASRHRRDSIDEVVADRPRSLEREERFDRDRIDVDFQPRRDEFSIPRDDFVSGPASTSGGIVVDPFGPSCVHCSMPHSSLVCPLVNPCVNCGQLGHELALCPNARPPAQLGVVEPLPGHLPGHLPCERCGQSGHAVNFCVTDFCIKCGASDHLAPQCRGGDVDFLMGYVGENGSAVTQENASPNKLPSLMSFSPGSCGKCGSFEHQADKCVLCRNCKDYGHISEKCPKIRCFKCMELGHVSGACPKVTGIICHKCHLPGHKAPDCPGKPTEFNAHANVICHKCSLPGHKAPDCPGKCHKCSLPGHKAPNCPGKCHRCGVAGHKAPECPTVTCFKCGVAGHLAPQCPVKITCHKCGEKGHKSPECPKSVVQELCEKCGGKGHKSLNCPSPGAICNKCGIRGHKTPDCPKNVCNNCLEPGHLYSNCTKCRHCLCEGHKANDCPNKEVVCDHCGVKGHPATTCIKCKRCKLSAHKEEDCPLKGCRICGVIGHVGDKCPNKAKILESKNPRLSMSCPECGRVGHSIATCPIAIIKKMKNQNEEKGKSAAATSLSPISDAKAEPDDDVIEIVAEKLPDKSVEKKRDSSASSKKKDSPASTKKTEDSSKDNKSKLAALLRYKSRSRLFDSILGLCELKIKSGDSGGYAKIFELMKELVDNADVDNSRDLQAYGKELKRELGQIRIDSWKKGNRGVAAFVADRLKSLVPKSMLPNKLGGENSGERRRENSREGRRENSGEGRRESRSGSRQLAAPEAEATTPASNVISFQSVLERSHMKELREMVARLMKTCRIRSEGNDTGGYLAIFDLFMEVLNLMRPRKQDPDVRPAFEILQQKLENLYKVAKDNASQERSGTALMIHRNLQAIFSQPMNTSPQ